MRTAFTLTSALILAASIGAAPAWADEGDKAMVMEVNRSLMEAMMKSDADRYRALTVEQLRVLAPGGRLEDRDMVIKGLGTVVGDLKLSEEDVLVVNDTAIMTGKMQGDAVMEPFGKLPTMKFIATFVRTDNGWRMLSRAITPCAPVAVERGVC